MRHRGLAVERVVEVGPLDPVSGAALYRAHARRVHPEAVDDDADVNALVAAVDGSPLALGLAAGRRRVLDAREVVARLRAGRLEVLGGGGPDLPSATDRSARRAPAAGTRSTRTTGPRSTASPRSTGSPPPTVEGLLGDRPDPLAALDRERLAVFASVRARGGLG
ncbi:MAG: hypothetical protein ABMB14_29760 [Myxococcota bacterium]